MYDVHCTFLLFAEGRLWPSGDDLMMMMVMVMITMLMMMVMLMIPCARGFCRADLDGES